MIRRPPGPPPLPREAAPGCCLAPFSGPRRTLVTLWGHRVPVAVVGGAGNHLGASSGSGEPAGRSA